MTSWKDVRTQEEYLRQAESVAWHKVNGSWPPCPACGRLVRHNDGRCVNAKCPWAAAPPPGDSDGK